MAPQLLEIRQRFRAQLGAHNIAPPPIVIASDILERDNLLAPLYKTFGKQEARGEFHVVSRRAHCDAERIFADPNFKRLFRSQKIVFSSRGAVIPFRNLRKIDATRCSSHQRSGFAIQLRERE